LTRLLSCGVASTRPSKAIRAMRNDGSKLAVQFQAVQAREASQPCAFKVPWRQFANASLREPPHFDISDCASRH